MLEALVWRVVSSLAAAIMLLSNPVVPGNIDLDHRIVVINLDGSFSTERSFSVNIDGLEVLLPTVIDGKVLSEDEAIDYFFKSGEHLGMFATIEEVEAYAVALHLRQEAYYSPE